MGERVHPVLCVRVLVVTAFPFPLSHFHLQGREKSLQILLSYSQAAPGRKAKQDQEEISRYHVQRLLLRSV